MRFSESEQSSPRQLDFVPRDRRYQIVHVIIAFAITMAMIFVIGYAPSLNNHSYTPLLSVLIVGALCFFVVYRKQANLDLVLTTEYQNLLFSQAVALGTSFCMFVRRDGTIVYANDGLRKLLPQIGHSESRALEAVFAQGGIAKEDRERVMGAIYASASERLIFPIKSESGEARDYVLTVEPLPRPAGFLVIRGREFRGQRAGAQVLPEVLRSTSVEKIDHILAHSPISQYSTDAFGKLEYVNPAMDTLLGYMAGEIIALKLTLPQLLFQVEGKAIGMDYALTDFNGEALLKRKQGTLVNVTMHQTVLRDAQMKVIGATGSLTPIVG